MLRCPVRVAVSAVCTFGLFSCSDTPASKKDAGAMHADGDAALASDDHDAGHGNAASDSAIPTASSPDASAADASAADASAADAGSALDGASRAVDSGMTWGNVVINEVESNGGTPGDWVELYNLSSQPIDISGWGLRDNDPSHAVFRIPAGTVIEALGYYVLDAKTSSTPAGFPFALDAVDWAYLYAGDGTTVVDSDSWTSHAISTYGRCPDGTGPFAQTSSSKGAPNLCDGGASAGETDASTDLPWPGPSTVADADAVGAITGNLSGLSYQAGATVDSSLLWGVRNSPSMLYRLHDNGTIYVSTTDNDWGAGKLIAYPNGMGSPDSEGVVYVPGASAGAGSLYVSTERDNYNGLVSRLSVLQYDANAAGTTLNALREWDLTADLPAVDANLGLESITFVPDAELLAQSFREDSGQPYNQARFAEQGGGVIIVGVEGTGMIYIYAFNHADGTYAKLSSFSSGMPALMDLAYDADTHYLWAYADNTQGNRAVLFEIEANMASLSYGKFVQRKVFAKPSGLPPYNNEGISFAPASECTGGLRSFFWADDSADLGHSLRRGAIPCGKTY